MMLAEIFSGTDPKPIGVRVGSIVRGYRIDGRDPTSGSYPGDVATEARNLMQNLRHSIESSGGSLAQVAQVSLRFANVAQDLPYLNHVWKELFPNPDERPTYKFMAGDFAGGPRMDAEYFAVLASGRRSINIRGVAHTNPIPMACAIGDYLFSSRILPIDAATGRASDSMELQWNHVLANTSAVLDGAGMVWSDITQGRLFIQDPALTPIIHKAWSVRFPEKSEPPLHIQPYVGAPTLKVMLEIMAHRSPEP